MAGKCFRKIISALIAAILTVTAVAPELSVNAADTVKVGIFPLGRFMMTDGTKVSGYNADYLAQIVTYTGWNVEYVQCESWPDATEKLESGEIDLLAPAQRTDALYELFDYSSFSMGVECGALFTLKATHSDVAFDDTEKIESLVIGAATGSTFLRHFNAYCEENNIHPNIVEYASNSEVMTALRAGEVEAAVSNIMFAADDLKLLKRFELMPVYYLVQKGNQSLLNQLNAAMSQIMTQDPSFSMDLYDTYYENTDASIGFELTQSELEYIKSSGVIHIGLNLSRYPFAEYDESTGTFSGIIVDLLNEISAQTGLKFEYKVQTGSVADMLTGGEYDLVGGVERDNFTGSTTVTTTNAFMESAVVPVGKTGTAFSFSSELKVAIPSSYQALSKALAANYPNLTVIGYGSNRECLDAVMAGDADVFVQNTHIISRLLQEPKYEGLDILPIEIMTEHTSIAMPSTADPLLKSILNKAITSMTASVVGASLIKHTFASPYQYTMSDFLYKFRVQIIIIAVLVLLCFALMACVIVIRRKNENMLQRKNNQLTEAVALADSANVAKTQFLAQMSHEIRTPMNAIIGLTTIARTEVREPAKVTDELNKISDSSRLLLSIINDVLDMSSIESGKLKIGSAPFDFKKLLSGLTTMFYQQAKTKSINFNVRLNGVTDETLNGDELRVNQILMNLLSNAVKFTPAGGEVSLTVLQTSRSHDKVFLRFMVVDTGSGMSEEMQHRLFRPFEQESASTARKHGGSGLGLSITKSLVEMMGGAIQCESTLNVGSTFTVDLPFGIATLQLENADELPDIRTLVVDDDEDSCTYTAILLNRLGVRHNTVRSGEAALEALGEAEEQNDPYKLCIVDWRMPEMNGGQLTKKIREIFGNDAVIIIVSAYDLNEIEAEAVAVGVDFFIPKPLFQSSILNALQRASGGKYVRADAGLHSVDYDFSGKRVLIAEDVELNMEVALKLLQIVKCEAVCAENGEEAVKLFEQSDEGTFDCILLDINMPVMDGYEAARRIRSCGRPDSKAIPIYAMTANAFSGDISDAMNAGMNGHIAKPIDTAILYQTLDKAFGGMESESL